ncbi:MAG TPA: CHAD domain-containing protein [Candidatus Hydrogenedentes bacterium]|nr:CHAD domain-containing protein [Candidatus Hydrogenedentota bacterium]HPC18029.1 CHAD domain-containing protein [Candidatus Hydrogenedentota bacterium]HRT21976.1 CHAD domain-containing protein [Candidatus Hydrogenedentota bacterium]HRT66666.1 CHAD domain-containing protein [Candidatus Hydrogenedentota bacterium]
MGARMSDPGFSPVKAYLKAQLREMRRKQEKLALEDPDAIHDVRVATRRLRALLSEQGRWFPSGRVKRAAGLLGTIGRGLGRARELDVCLELLKTVLDVRDAREKDSAAVVCPKSAVSSLYTLRSLEEMRATESSAVQRAARLLAGERFARIFTELSEVRGSHAPYGPKRASRRMGRRYESVIETYLAWLAHPSEETLHRLRIAFKKLRYTCEIYRKCTIVDAGQPESKSCNASSEAHSLLERFIDELKAAQDRLGEWHDVVVLRRYLVQIVEDAPDRERPGCRALLLRLDKASAKRLRSFQSYARRFFGKAKTAKTRAMLDGLFKTPSPKTKAGKNGDGHSGVQNVS